MGIFELPVISFQTPAKPGDLAEPPTDEQPPVFMDEWVARYMRGVQKNCRHRFDQKTRACVRCGIPERDYLMGSGLKPL